MEFRFKPHLVEVEFSLCWLVHARTVADGVRQKPSNAQITVPIVNNFMKKLLTLLTFVLFGTAAQAQTLKWTAAFPGNGAASATDGSGGLLYCYYPAGGELVRCIWLDSAGHGVMTNDYPLGPSGGGVYAVARFNRTELALQLIQDDGPGRVSNILRRFKRTKSGVVISDKELDLKEQLDSIPTTLVDAKGYFTHAANTNQNGITIRRYSN